MSEIIAKVAKIAFFVILVGILLSFLVTVVSSVTDISNDITDGFAQLPIEVTWYFKAGREIANNFIFPEVFNGCITVWLAGTATLIANYALHAIGSKIAGINS